MEQEQGREGTWAEREEEQEKGAGAGKGRHMSREGKGTGKGSRERKRGRTWKGRHMSTQREEKQKKEQRQDKKRGKEGMGGNRGREGRWAGKGSRSREGKVEWAGAKTDALTPGVGKDNPSCAQVPCLLNCSPSACFSKHVTKHSSPCFTFVFKFLFLWWLNWDKSPFLIHRICTFTFVQKNILLWVIVV
jgi:hypothetical protein